MAVVLAGGCRVTEMHEGAPMVMGTAKIWQQVGRATGAEAISLRILEFAPGLSKGIRNCECDEVLYLLEVPDGPEKKGAKVTAFIDGWAQDVESQTGIYLQPGTTFTVNNTGPQPAIFVSSQCPAPLSEPEIVSPVTSPLAESARPNAIVRLSDRRSIPTADRWFRILVDDEVGSAQVTQFVGSIPPGRAPEHFHNYEEVLFILRGAGRMWADETNTTIAPGSCIYLPKGQVHCVENTGRDELRLLGVFYPAGSPSVRYDVEEK